MRWVSLAFLAAAGVVLAVFWGDVPDRWIIHWGLHGPDGWAVKSAPNAAWPLILGVGMWLLFEGLAVVTTRGAGRSGFPPAMGNVMATVERAVGLALSIVFAALAVALPLLHPQSSWPIAIGFPLVIGLVVGGAMVWAWRETRRLRAAGVDLPEGYAGAFYTNPRDARLWVPKAAGIGWTINFAHRLAWPVMIALVGVPLAIVLLVIALAR